MQVLYVINDRSQFQIFYQTIKTIKRDGDEMECVFHQNGILLLAGKSSLNEEKAKSYFYFEKGFFQRIVTNQPGAIAINIATLKNFVLRLKGLHKSVKNCGQMSRLMDL